MSNRAWFVGAALVIPFQLGISQCGNDEGVTWYKDVYPITHASCEGCHTTGGIGPFSVETYELAAPYASAMASSVQSGYMPPWMPDESCQTFQDARVLTQEEIDTITEWSRQGAPAGDPADAPVDDTTESGLPWIDVTLEPAEPFTPSGDYMDEYRCFVLDPQRTEDQYLIGYQVNPGEASEVHHVLLYETDLAEAQALDAEDEESGYLCFGGTNTSSSNMIGGWAPGTPVTEFPTDTGIKVKAGTAVVMQIHYNLANGDPLPDQTSINLQYAHAPVLYPASFEGIFHDDFVIPPYAFDYSSSKTITVDSDITVWGAFPHMHQLGKKIDVTLTHADTNDCLISIPEWDFHWQQLYLYDAPTGVPVYSGDKVKLTCTWSNDTGQTVTWGEGTSDEMCLSYFYVTGQVGE